MRFEIFKSKTGQWYWRLVSSNGKVIAQSEAYKRRTGAAATIASIKSSVPRAKVVDAEAA